jgi:hypothetical protein
MTWTEIATTVQIIMETSNVEQGSLIGGRRQLRNDEKCDSAIFVGSHE